ncbi:MAG: hypothetical protein QNI87_12535 [Erythrobacter sp.]|uniref:hypothetical protein n=1 Tax=Erythrobacter sp. TaxID=1042 RepID=UPI002630E6F1|nr:hypothetical protein [Erythrobacter sp.]MDJ0979345.1 hypothetical protein [Erythrobacter sp.]
MSHIAPLRFALSALAVFGLSACAANTYTGPVEVTRFIGSQPAGLGQGTIALRFSEELENEAALDAFRGAISDELSLLGYTVIANEEIADQIATISTSRTSIPAAEGSDPVNVGVGGSTGSFGSGVGVGVGINLGGNRDRSPRVISELSVAIASNTNDTNRQNLWEARAQFPTSVNSPYAPVAVNARTLAAAVFKDFPAGSGDTVSIDVDELVEQP